MILDFLNYSINSLRVRKTRTLLTMIGIFIGIAAVISLISLGSGFQNAILEQFSDVGVDKLVIQAAETGFGPPGSTALDKLTDDDFKAVEKTPGVKTAAKRYIRYVKVEFRDKVNYYGITSLPEERDARELVMNAANFEASEGRMLKSNDGYKAVVGNAFHESEKFPKKINVGDKIIIEDNEFEVVGVLEKIGNPQFNEIFIINEKPLEEILDTEGETDMIVAQVSNVDEIEKVADDIEKELRKSRNVDEGEEDFSVETPEQAIESFTTILNVVNVVLIGIAAISLIVGGIGIMNTMYTAVIERTKEIGIMKSIGAKNSDILLIFLIESGILGLVGGAIGVLLGIGFSKLVEAIAAGAGYSIIKVSFPISWIIGTLLFAFFVGSISGVFPAYKASKLKPVDALRYE